MPRAATRSIFSGALTGEALPRRVDAGHPRAASDLVIPDRRTSFGVVEMTTGCGRQPPDMFVWRTDEAGLPFFVPDRGELLDLYRSIAEYPGVEQVTPSHATIAPAVVDPDHARRSARRRPARLAPRREGTIAQPGSRAAAGIGGSMIALFVIGRIVFGAFFVWHGIDHFRHEQMMTQYTRMKGVPAPQTAVLASGLMIIIGGLSIMLGWRPVVGVTLIVLFLLSVALLMHNFWTLTDPQARMADRINFEKNIALAGAALMLLAIPRPWPLGIG